MVTAASNTSTPATALTLSEQLRQLADFFEQHPGAAEAALNVNVDSNRGRGSQTFRSSVTFYGADILHRLFAGSRASVKHRDGHDFYTLDDSDIRLVGIQPVTQQSSETEVIL